MITSDDLNGLENLEQFYVGKNQLTSLPDDLFVGMSKLTMVSFNGNRIERMSSKLLQNIAGNQLVYVDFRGNATIDALYEPERSKSVKSLEVLMGIIDETLQQTCRGFQRNFLSKQFSRSFKNFV